MADISKITVPINGTNTTFDIKALKSLSVPIATVDSTSTSTEFTVQVPEFAIEPELRDGLFFFIYNNKVASASGWTLRVNDFDAKPVYNASAERVTTGFAKTRLFPIWYSSTLVSGGCWIIGYLTDANTTYSVFTNLSQGTGAGYLANSVVYRYQLLFQMDDNTVTPLNNVSNSTGTAKAMLTNVEFDPFGEILYYNSTTTVNANARVPGGNSLYMASLDLRYTFNCASTLTAFKSFYLVVSLQSNGKVKIADATPWAQDLPSTADGLYYILLGRTYSAYQLSLSKEHPIYYHDGTGIKEYINPNIAIEDSDTHRPVQVNGTEVLGNNTTALNLIPGSNVSITNGTSGITIAATNTTYSSKTAASGGTDVSLVTTGEKYTWNSKTSNTGTVTKISTGVGLTGGDVTVTGTIKAKLRSETALTIDSAAATTTSGRVYPVAVDKTGYLAVNVPWTDTNTQTITGVKGNSETSYRTGNVNITAANIGLGNVNNTSDANKPVSTATQAALNAKADLNRGIEFIRGTWTEASGAWTGVTADAELYDGKQIILFMPFAGSGNATLNLTLSGGGTTGAKNVYYENTTRFTTHKGQNSQLHLIYHSAFTLSDGNTYEGWWYVANRDTNDTEITNLRIYNGQYIADSAIYRYQLLFQQDENTLTPLNNNSNVTGTTKTMLTSVEFNPFGRIFYFNSTSTCSANANISAGRLYWSITGLDLRYTFNCGETLTAHRPVYLTVTPTSDGMCKISDTTPWAQSLPTTDDGNWYIFLGRTYSTYQMALQSEHPVYAYRNGRYREISPYTYSNADLLRSGLMSPGQVGKLETMWSTLYGSSTTLAVDLETVYSNLGLGNVATLEYETVT